MIHTLRGIGYLIKGATDRFLEYRIRLVVTVLELMPVMSPC
jgi:hypothetical protein